VPRCGMTHGWRAVERRRHRRTRTEPARAPSLSSQGPPPTGGVVRQATPRSSRC